MMKEPQALFLPLKETGIKPPPQNTLVVYLPGASKDQSDKNVDEAMEVLSLMDRPFESATEQVNNTPALALFLLPLFMLCSPGGQSRSR